MEKKNYLDLKVRIVSGNKTFKIGDHVKITGKAWLRHNVLDFKGTITAIHANRGGIGNSFINVLSDSGVHESITLAEIERLEKIEEDA